jgi:Flp pilus assembly protein TadD
MPGLHKFAATVLLGLALGSGMASAGDIQDIDQLFQQGNLAEALTRTDQFLQKSPGDAQARFLKGLILARQGKSDDAIRIFTGLTEDYPELPEPYNNLAVLYAAQGKYDDARRALERAIHALPGYATAHENLGDLYAKMASIAYAEARQLDHANVTSGEKQQLIDKALAIHAPANPAASGKAAP